MAIPTSAMSQRQSKNRLNKKKKAIKIAVSPVRPPAFTPAALSRNAVVVDRPNRGPIVVARASTCRVLSSCLSLPLVS